MLVFDELLKETAALHGHLCAGQVIGVRMAMIGCREIGIDEPKGSKKILVYVEIDRCATDAIRAVTGCSLGRRSLKFLDYGKMAATFVNLESNKAVRVIARDDAREQVPSYAGESLNRHEAERIAYSVMPEESLFRIGPVQIQIPEEDMPGARGRRVLCTRCGEGINFRREVNVNGSVLCIPCYQGSYIGRISPAGDLPPVIHIVGKKNSGKTTLIEKIIPELCARGYRAATVKHHHSERPIDLDWKGKDSWKHRNAGAKAVAVVSRSETALFQETDEMPPLSQVIANMKGVDLVLAEGFGSESQLEIRIIDDPSVSDLVYHGHERLIALVGPAKSVNGIPNFGRDDTKPLAYLIEKEILSRRPVFNLTTIGRFSGDHCV